MMVAYGGTPLPQHDVVIRLHFQADVCQMRTYYTAIRCDGDDRVIMENFPKSTVPG